MFSIAGSSPCPTEPECLSGCGWIDASQRTRLLPDFSNQSDGLNECRTNNEVFDIRVARPFGSTPLGFIDDPVQLGVSSSVVSGGLISQYHLGA